MSVPPIVEGTARELEPYLKQSPTQRFRLIALPEIEDASPESGANVLRDPERVARVQSIRGKFARNAGELGSEELHRQRQQDKLQEEWTASGDPR